jgi:hypothetical protein
MTIKVKTGGAYAEPAGIFAKKDGSYAAISEMSVKLGEAYVPVFGGGVPPSGITWDSAATWDNGTYWI